MKVIRDPTVEVHRLEAEVEALKRALQRVRRSRAVLMEVLAMRVAQERRVAARRTARRKRFDGLPPHA